MTNNVAGLGASYSGGILGASYSTLLEKQEQAPPYDVSDDIHRLMEHLGNPNYTGPLNFEQYCVREYAWMVLAMEAGEG